MKLKTVLSAALALLLSVVSLSAQINFKVARRGPDADGAIRAYSKNYNLVCITDPGVTATINGQSVKVYNTGAFGMPLTLTPGSNNVTVNLSKGKESRTEVLEIILDPTRPRRDDSAPRSPEDSLKDVFIEKPFYGTTLDGAYLQYSFGGDRLGASKMGFLEKGITLKIAGQINEVYKVQLSDTRWAYIPTEYVTPCAKESKCVITNNMSISNQGKFDRISLSFPEKKPYAAWPQFDPTIINVDIFGAMNNSNWITHAVDLEMVDFVNVEQVESDVCRLVIKLKEKYAWGYAISYDGNILHIDVKHAPKPTLDGMIIGLDAGHGGESSPGAISTTGIKESTVNLDIVFRTKKLLENKGAKVVLSRTEDREVSMADRRKFFKDAGADLVVSIHNNAGGGPFKPMGTSTYYKWIVNRELAACLLNRMLELGVPNYGLVGNFNFSLGVPIEYPTVLVEGLFMSSLPDEEMIADEACRQKIATKVVLGIEDYLKKVADAQKAAKKRK